MLGRLSLPWQRMRMSSRRLEGTLNVVVVVVDGGGGVAENVIKKSVKYP